MTPAQNPLDDLHPAVRTWFQRRFPGPSEAQTEGWREILAGRDTLIAAPTGSGKTLAAFLVSIDRLLRLEQEGALDDEIQVVYVSPLKALSNDIQRNLEEPLREISATARELGGESIPIRTAVRSGDTPQSERQRILRRPPHILITTPESLYLMLTAERAREKLRRVRTVIVDEIHALIRDKRGSHLALTLARLDHVAEKRPSRIGLSATQRPIEATAHYLCGEGNELPCSIINTGHKRDLDLAIELPETDLEAVCSHDHWGDIFKRLVTLIKEHQTVLVFVNTRRQAERIAHQLADELGEEVVASHHGSLSKERRLALEARLKGGFMKALVATASLELGIDIGAVDLVCQIESPRSLATFLQRVGRSGHALGLTPKGRLFPTTRDDLLECAAMIRGVREGQLDRLCQPIAPLDVLAQQVVAECACEPWKEEELFEQFRRASPYARLEREAFDRVVVMLSEGILTGNGPVARYLHRDQINGMIRARRHGRLTAIQCGGTIPEVADYRVVAEPDDMFVGTVDEDFAVESMAGDIFVLGSTSWQVRRVEKNGVMRVADARGAPPTVPFWIGEAPGRTAELSEEVSQLRVDLAAHEKDDDAIAWLSEIAALPEEGADQIVRYVRAQEESVGVVPSREDIVYERFFDESGGMQLVVHAPFGARVNRGFGLALRKRFCQNFDFELQAAASDDAVLLSLGPRQSFPLDDVTQFLRPESLEEILTQAMLVSPMFATRWRWNATRALAVLRMRQGKKVPPPLQRMRSDDLLASVFPSQVACQEHVTYPIEIPDHPLIQQTVDDCLHEAMDVDALRDVVQKILRKEIRVHVRDTSEPSPFAHEILNGKPFTFLDDAPLEERRSRAITLRRSLPERARDLGKLDEDAIRRVCEQAWPEPRCIEETHEAITSFLVVDEQDVPTWRPWLDELASARRAATITYENGRRAWFAAENATAVSKLFPTLPVSPPIDLPEALLNREPPQRPDVMLIQGHLDFRGPITAEELAERTGLPTADVKIAVAALEQEGVVLRGKFRPQATGEEFCSRRLLARIHRETLTKLRSEIEPVSVADFIRFLLRWQHVDKDARVHGKRGLLEVINRLQGFEAPARCWEESILPSRVRDYRSSWLDELCLAGEVTWARLSLASSAQTEDAKRLATSKATPITLACRRDLGWLTLGVRAENAPVRPTTGTAADVYGVLKERGALFLDEIQRACGGRLPLEVEDGLWDLVARGLVNADGFQTLRSLMRGKKKADRGSQRRRLRLRPTFDVGSPAGRWSLWGTHLEVDVAQDELAEAWAEQLLTRYGVLFRDLLAREDLALPWRSLLRALRKMEDRGTVRGGRFVAGVYGEQYAWPEAVESLRAVRRREVTEEVTTLAAVDPLNLKGILTSGARIPSMPNRQMWIRAGVPLEEAPAGTVREKLARYGAERWR